jgi:type I restriction enzyme S subunit
MVYHARHIKEQSANIPSVSKKDVAVFKVSVPIKKEQQKIASFLSSIDKKIEITSTQLEKTREFKKGLLQQMFV